MEEFRRGGSGFSLPPHIAEDAGLNGTGAPGLVEQLKHSINTGGLKFTAFSKNQKHPVTGKQYSLIYTGDSQETHGEIFGWHPPHGEHSFIQQRMAAIFADTLRKILLPKEYINE